MFLFFCVCFSGAPLLNYSFYQKKVYTATGSSVEKPGPNAALVRTRAQLGGSSVLLEFPVSALFSEDCISFADALGRVDDPHFCHNGIQY